MFYRFLSLDYINQSFYDIVKMIYIIFYFLYYFFLFFFLLYFLKNKKKNNIKKKKKKNIKDNYNKDNNSEKFNYYNDITIIKSISKRKFRDMKM